MKYGDTLRQRSIPEWSHYNVDYDVIKGLIKEHTTPGSGKAVSIPGQGDPVEKDFERKLYALLAEENDRVNLFVKSKAGEIERRLNHLDRQLANLEPLDRPLPPGHRPRRRLERYVALDREVLKTGQEINSLSRFINAQKTAFRKLLKKYKKWTHSEDLVNQFTRELTTVPESFWNLEVEPLFDQYTAVLHIVRDAFQGKTRSDSPSASLQAQQGTALPGAASRLTSQLRASIEANDLAGFDALFASAPAGSSGGTATYWVHPDGLIELQVLLLQHSRLCTPPSSLRTPPFSSRGGSPALRRANSDLWKEGLVFSSREDDMGIVVLDDLHRFVSAASEGASIPSVEDAYRSHTGVGAEARWTCSGDAIVTTGTVQDPNAGGSSAATTRLKRKYLRTFFDTDAPFNTRSLSFSSASGIAAATGPPRQDSVEQVRQWLKEHDTVKPLAGICAKRSRFAGLANSSSRSIWATLDRDIVMKRSVLDDCAENDWSSAIRRDSVGFPYAVLRVRHEGLAMDSLTKVLDASHLTERVDDFCLEKQAIWECCRPDAAAPPPWLPLLSKDIRKLPEAQKRHSRRSSNVMFQIEAPTSQPTSNSTGSVAEGGYTESSTPAKAASSNTSLYEISDSPAPARNQKPGRRTGHRSRPSRQNSVSEHESRYWSEYDHPEDGDDADAYYIYIDPNESYKWPGTDTAKAVYRKVKDLFKKSPHADEEAALLRPSLRIRTDGDDSDSDSTSEDESPDTPNYGSISHTAPKHTNDRPGFLSTVFPTRSGSMLPAASSHPPALLAMENRDREREQTKFRLYVTCLLASLVILVTVVVLRATGRKRLRPEVDAGVLFGIAADLVFAFAGVGYMLSRQDELGWLHRGIVFSTVALVCVVDGMMVASMVE